MSHAQPRFYLIHVPIPVEMVYIIHPTPQRKAVNAMPKTIHHWRLAIPSTGAATSTVMSWYDLSPVTRVFESVLRNARPYAIAFLSLFYTFLTFV